jgi:hypothetical protein
MGAQEPIAILKERTNLGDIAHQDLIVVVLDVLLKFVSRWSNYTSNRRPEAVFPTPICFIDITKRKTSYHQSRGGRMGKPSDHPTHFLRFVLQHLALDRTEIYAMLVVAALVRRRAALF